MDSDAERVALVGIGEGPPVPIDLDPDNIACARHGEPFRANWPEGYMAFALELFNTIINDEELMNIEGEDVQGLINRRPMCEWVSGSDLMVAYLKSGVGKPGACIVCHQEYAIGTPYSMGKQEYDHVCFECVITRLRPLN